LGAAKKVEPRKPPPRRIEFQEKFGTSEENAERYGRKNVRGRGDTRKPRGKKAKHRLEHRADLDLKRGGDVTGGGKVPS